MTIRVPFSQGPRRASRLLRRAAWAWAAVLLLSPPTSAQLDESLWSQLLERYTIEVGDLAGTRVDYRALLKSGEWPQLIASLAGSQPDTLERRDQRLAFWINAYNILAIDLVLRHYPVRSIRDIGSLITPVWDVRAGTIGERDYSLDQIEDEILRPIGDPRIHFAIVCASLSCPSLRREPYVAERIDPQLDDQMARFLADPRKGVRLERERRTIYLSSIFKWFRGDWDGKGGVLHAIAGALPEGDRRWLEAQGEDLRVRYLDYDWSLNDTTDAMVSR